MTTEQPTEDELLAKAIGLYAEVLARDKLIEEANQRVNGLRYKNPYSNKRLRQEAMQRIGTDVVVLIKERNEKLKELEELQKGMAHPPIDIVSPTPPPDAPQDNRLPAPEAVPHEVSGSPEQSAPSVA